MEPLRGSQGYDDPYSAEDDLDDPHMLEINGTGQVRAELRDRIHRKRKQAGLDYIVIEPKGQIREVKKTKSIFFYLCILFYAPYLLTFFCHFSNSLKLTRLS